jgi:hypothetical protein
MVTFDNISSMTFLRSPLFKIIPITTDIFSGLY